MTLLIVDLWQYCVCCIRSGVTQCTLLMVWSPGHALGPFVTVRVSRDALVAHRYTYALPRCGTSQYRITFIALSVSLWNDLADPVFDGVGLAGFKCRANVLLALLPPTILLFHSNLPTPHPPIANYIDICLPDICHIQDLLKVLCTSPSHLYIITQYLSINILCHLINCLLTFPHSLYLFSNISLLPSKLFPNRSPHHRSAILFATCGRIIKTLVKLQCSASCISSYNMKATMCQQCCKSGSSKIYKFIVVRLYVLLRRAHCSQHMATYKMEQPIRNVLQTIVNHCL